MCPYDSQIEWFSKAFQELKSAEILFEHDADLGIVCFHCQQAIEKYLKGYLIIKAGKIFEGHSLIKLCKYAMEYNTGFSGFLKDFSFVNSFYIETRYPAEDALIVTREDVTECMRITNSAIGYINKIL